MKLLLLLAVLVAGLMYWRRDRGRPHAPYFHNLQKLLKADGVGQPRMIIDLDRVDANIEQVRRYIDDTSVLRIPAKSLPSFEMLEYLQNKLGTSRIMAFHQPFLSQMLRHFPDTDFLIGKPFPVAAAREVISASEISCKDASERVQWLIDNLSRLEQYLLLAQEKDIRLKISIEIDVGLHRGGITHTDSLKPMLQLIKDNTEHLLFSGFMGYEPYLNRLSGLLEYKRQATRNKVLQTYQSFVDVVRHDFPELWHDKLCFNSGGSTTYQLYPESDRGPVNDLAIGSALVQPIDFDVDTITGHQPAAFIAAPVIKALDGVQLPLLERFSHLWARLSPNLSKAFFTYGGWWKANPVSPEGLSNNVLYGRSTNQELFTGSAATGLAADDFVFLRPTQSELVFLQFGRLLLVREDKIVGEWQTFNLDY